MGAEQAASSHAHHEQRSCVPSASRKLAPDTPADLCIYADFRCFSNCLNFAVVQIDLGPILQPLCRHSMVVSDSSCLVFGGYDGSTASNQLIRIDLQPVQQLQRSSLQDLINSMACCGSTCSGSDGSNAWQTCSNKGLTSKAQSGLSAAEAVAAAVGGSADGEGGSGDAGSGGTLKAVGVVLPPALQVPPAVKALSKKAGPPPLKLSDLPNAEEVAAMPQWKQVRQLHQVSCRTRGGCPLQEQSSKSTAGCWPEVSPACSH